jgi:hypothetical protein
MSRYAKTFRGSEIRLPGPLALIREGATDTALAWYSNAGLSVAEFAKARDLDPGYVADVTAILSPRVTVKRNGELASRYLSDPHGDGVLLQVVPSVASAIRYHAAHRAELGTEAIRGDKTRNFSYAIQGDASAVVVDVWTVRGLGWTDKRIGKRVYREAVAVVRSLAKRAGLTPREAQAALWYGTRARYGYKGASNSGNLVLPV